MTTAQLVEYVSSGVLTLSLSYLIWRTLKQVGVQRRSYQQLPFEPFQQSDSDDERVERAQAALLGVALGDALGMPRESLPVWFANLRYGRAPKLSRGLVRFMRRRGTVSDDTQLTLATARSIEDGGYDAERFERQLVAWAAHAIGPGRATLAAAKGWGSGEDRRDFDSQGNGAAMRVVPVAIAFGQDIERMVEVVRENAEATHPNPEAIAGAESIARIVAWLLERARDESIDADPLVETALPRTTTRELSDWQARLEDAVRSTGSDRRLSAIGTTGWVKHTVPAIVYLLVEYGDDIDAALTELWACGGDVDTIAALYLGCVGAWKGLDVFDAMPVREVQGAGVLVEQAESLA